LILFGTEYFFWVAVKTHKVYITIILRIALYGRETWSFTLREERRLSVFDNRVLRKMSGPKGELEETGNSRA
jgi:hypothetical protein